jgi:hypothetical protein
MSAALTGSSVGAAGLQSKRATRQAGAATAVALSRGACNARMAVGRGRCWDASRAQLRVGHASRRRAATCDVAALWYAMLTWRADRFIVPRPPPDDAPAGDHGLDGRDGALQDGRGLGAGGLRVEWQGGGGCTRSQRGGAEWCACRGGGRAGRRSGADGCRGAQDSAKGESLRARVRARVCVCVVWVCVLCVGVCVCARHCVLARTQCACVRSGVISCAAPAAALTAPAPLTQA